MCRLCADRERVFEKSNETKTCFEDSSFFSAKVNFVAEAEKTGFTSCSDAVLGSNETGLVTTGRAGTGPEVFELLRAFY